jgi:hypothetical protein
MSDLGDAWRSAAAGGGPVPKSVRDWWSLLLEAVDTPMSSLSDDRRLCEALLQLCAVADEACQGIGIFELQRVPDSFETKAADIPFADPGDDDAPSTLCEEIDPYRVIPLPKLTHFRLRLVAA